jgi:hypothetical protein
MRRMKRLPWVSHVCLFGIAAVLAGTASAQLRSPGMAADSGDDKTLAVGLVPQDQSDCQNSNVVDNGTQTRGGEVRVTRRSNGITTVKVAMTVSPRTRYNFFLKCVRQLGTVTTDDEGVGITSFDFPTNSVGNVYAFDSYPDGAPPGNKFQSEKVSFQ